ncbi:MAG TPA: phosphoglycerate kinase [Candidatus Limnocylindria bacterium]|nr:phosphoglycerate kinase [Candidatus Limnocylindria bacterium]
MITLDHLHHNFTDWNLAHQRVFLRADLNVPLHNGTIMNDYRLQALLPTLAVLTQRGAKIILATHIGRPQEHDQQFSTRHLIPWFQAHGYQVEFQEDLEQAYQASKQDTPTIVLLENVRFFAGEKTSDHTFAQNLARLADYYVNDAFAVVHRNDTSVTLVPNLFPPERRSIGLLIQQELTMLNQLLNSVRKPFVLILGGGKAADKLPLLQRFLTIADTIILCPALVFTFLKALGKPVGASLVDTAHIQLCKQIYEQAQQHGVQLVFPLDYQVAHATFNGPLSYVDAEQFPKDGVGISIGPKTQQLIAPLIAQAGTIFCNGLMGSIGRPESLQGADMVYSAMATSPAFTVIGGGDSVAVAQRGGYDKNISYISTGGGATLAYLAGQELPGLKAFVD